MKYLMLGTMVAMVVKGISRAAVHGMVVIDHMCSMYVHQIHFHMFADTWPSFYM
jgi:hypothetical protein